MLGPLQLQRREVFIDEANGQVLSSRTLRQALELRLDRNPLAQMTNNIALGKGQRLPKERDAEQFQSRYPAGYAAKECSVEISAENPNAGYRRPLWRKDLGRSHLHQVDEPRGHIFPVAHPPTGIHQPSVYHSPSAVNLNAH